MKKSEAIDHLRRSRRALLESLADVPEDLLMRSKQINGGSLKDLMGHIAAWDEETLRVIRAFALQGETKFSYAISRDKDFALWNAEQATRRKDFSAAEIRRELEMARRDLIQVVDSLTEPVLTRVKMTPWKEEKSAYSLIEDQVEHEFFHQRQIASWRRKIDRWKRARAKLTVKRKQNPSGSGGV